MKEALYLLRSGPQEQATGGNVFLFIIFQDPNTGAVSEGGPQDRNARRVELAAVRYPFLHNSQLVLAASGSTRGLLPKHTHRKAD